MDSKFVPGESDGRPVVVVVEDNRVALKTYEQMFASLKELKEFRLVFFDRAAPALEWMESMRESDLPVAIFLDWIMDGPMDGIGFLQSLRKRAEWKKIPVIMVSSNRDKDEVEKALRTGVQDYIIKPIMTKLLVSKLMKVLGRAPAAYTPSKS